MKESSETMLMAAEVLSLVVDVLLLLLLLEELVDPVGSAITRHDHTKKCRSSGVATGRMTGKHARRPTILAVRGVRVHDLASSYSETPLSERATSSTR